MLIPCMGGWCAKRMTCPNYTEADRNDEPAERLCERGHDGVLADVTADSIRSAPVRIEMPHGQSLIGGAA